MRRLVAVIGSGEPDAQRDRLAEQVGAAIVGSGFGIVCGGLGGVMQAACRGAHDAAPEMPIVAVLPGPDRCAANPYANIVIPTGMGYARNLVVVLSADAVVAVGGASGTLSEMAHAWQLGKPLCALAAVDGWAAELAGRALDDKRTDTIFEARTVADVAGWLAGLV